MTQKQINRRNFMAASAVLAGSTVLTGRSALAQDAVDSPYYSGADIVPLGKTGMKTSRLGIGTGSHGGRDQLEMGQTEFVKMARHAYDRGIRYIDTADAYMMHLFIRFALKELPREDMFIQSKTKAVHPEVARAHVERFRREMRVDYIDSLLLHAARVSTWTEDRRAVIDVLLEEKEKGRIRALGVSCHGMDPLLEAVACPEIDIHLVRINPDGAVMDGPPDQVVSQIDKMHAKGRGVIAMKVFGNGTFIDAAVRQKSIEYVLGLEGVDAMTIGFKSIAEVDEGLKMISAVKKG